MVDILDKIIGQRELKASLKVAILSAQRRGVPLGHFLLSGSGGLGKSHIIKAIGGALNYHVEITQGNRLGIKDVGPFLIERCGLANGKTSLIVIDEIHEMGLRAQEELYVPLEDSKVITSDGVVFLPPFTLAGATTAPDELDSNSLVERFANHWKLRDLNKAELMAIICKFFLSDNKIGIHGEEMVAIALRSRGNPRIALRYSAKVLDYAAASGERTEIRMEHINQAFSELKIDENGLDEDQRRYLALLGGNENPIGLNAIANSLGRRPEQVEKVIEPYLWKLGLITSSSRGRELTSAGYLYG